MKFKNTLCDEGVKEVLRKEIISSKIPHAQLFQEVLGTSGFPLAIAFVTYLFCDKKSKYDSCGKCADCVKMYNLTHPDLHIFYPTTGSTKDMSSKGLFNNFREFVKADLNIFKEDWQIKNKMKSSGEIKVRDIGVINKIINLKSYEGNYKVFIIWQPEHLNIFAANKLLKTLEEPTPKTIFILISNDSESILGTIKSRLQTKKIKPTNKSALSNYFQKYFHNIDPKNIEYSIHKNHFNYFKIRGDIGGDIYKNNYESLFIDWIRLCFLSKSKKNIAELIEFCNQLSNNEKSIQAHFIQFSTNVFRSAFFFNYKLDEFIAPAISREDFDMDKFSKFITSNNILDIFDLLNSSCICLKNKTAPNSKILFLDLSLKLGMLLHDS